MKNIYVGNLAFSTTEEELRSMFENYGAVENVTLVRDRDTGQPRGFGFVEMTDAGEAERAIAAINGTEVGGRALTVNEARPRPEKRSSGGGFGGPKRAAGGGFRGGRGGGGGRNRF